jgi:hypothetical protein
LTKIPANECLIWWLTQDDYQAIGDANPEWPEYLQREYRSRRGRPGRGRLWEADLFEPFDIEWDDAKPMAAFAGQAGGIVIRWMDAIFVRKLPGFLTDIHLNKQWGPSE